MKTYNFIALLLLSLLTWLLPPSLREALADAPVEVADSLSSNMASMTTPITRYVDRNGDNSANDCTNSLNPYLTIQHAVDEALSNDLILIASGTYTENLKITKSLTLQGDDQLSTIVDGNAIDSVVTITGSVTVTLTQLTLTNGLADQGGALYNGGDRLLLDHVTVRDNHTRNGVNGTGGGDGSDGGYGGGIFNTNDLILSASTVMSNSTGHGGAANGTSMYHGGAGGHGGGIYSTGNFTLTESIVSHNTTGRGGGLSGLTKGGPGGAGGGIYSTGHLQLFSCIIQGNQTGAGGFSGSGNGVPGGDGGGIYASNLTESNCTISDNKTGAGGGGHSRGGQGGQGGGIYTTVSLQLFSSTVMSNSTGNGGNGFGNGGTGGDGGGIFGSTGSLELLNSTFSDNRTGNGGGGYIGNDGDGGSGGGIYQAGSGEITIGYATITNNQTGAGGSGASAGLGGGLFIESATYSNTIVAGNSREGIINDDCQLSGTFISAGYNLVGDGTGCTTDGNTDLSVNPPDVLTTVLGPLQDNGGDTLTHALLASSPAIDAIPTSSANCSTGDKDQRAARRANGTNQGGSACDIGAYEVSTILTADSTLGGSVTLQGRPPAPHSRWSVPLRVSLTISGEDTPAYEFMPTTDENGHFTLTGIEAGTYKIRVKHSHTLQNMQTVTLTGGNNTMDFGELREGDANDDNYVTIIDFSILAATFGICEGTDGYDARADFNEDSCVTILDFSLLASNFGQSGQNAPMTPNRASEVRSSDVAMSIGPAQSTIKPGDTFNVTVRLDAGEQQVDGAQIGLNFNPAMLVVEEVMTGDKLALELANQVDNESGTIQFAAGTLQDFPSGSIDVMEVQFKALSEGETALAFDATADGAMGSNVTFAGASVLGSHADGVVTVNEPTAVRVIELAAPATTGWLWALAPLGMMMLAGGIFLARKPRRQ